MAIIRGLDLAQRIEAFAPLEYAESWDHCGLQLGDLKKPIHKVMTTLDVRPEVVQEAIELGVDFIVAHHPMMFKPAYDLDLANPQNRMYADLLRHNITVYAAHTNLDKVSDGMNDWLAQVLGISATTPLIKENNDSEVGLGRIGNLPAPTLLKDYANRICQAFNVEHVRVVSQDLEQFVRRVAVIGGSGSEFYQIAKDQGADVLVTADVTYHTAHDILSSGISVIDPGHHMEFWMKTAMQQFIKDWSNETDWELDVVQSNINTDPFQFV